MNETVYLGDSIEVNFKCVDGKSAPIDITGATLACSAQTPGGSVIVAASVALDNAAAGLWHAIFTTSQTAGFTPDTVYSYDGVVRLASGAVVTCGYGSVKTRKRISATP